MTHSITSPNALPLDFLDLDRGNIPVPSMLNTRIAIEMLKLDCRYDVFHDRYTINGSEFGNSALQISDAVARQLREMVRLRFKFEPGIQHAMDALYRACEASAPTSSASSPRSRARPIERGPRMVEQPLIFSAAWF